jgi:hypothetical protein
MFDKLGPKSNKCFFIGYPRETKSYYFYHRLDNKVFVARNSVFLEEELLSKEYSGSKVTLEEIQDTILMLRVKPKWNKFQARLWNKFNRHHVLEGRGE